MSVDINIERLNIRLPAGFEARADSIARQLSKRLRNISLSSDGGGDYRVLNLPRLVVASGDTDGAIAKRIALGIQHQINSRNHGTASTPGDNQ